MVGHIRISLTQCLYLTTCISVRTYIPSEFACEPRIYLILLDTIYEYINSLFMNQSGCEEDFYHWYYFLCRSLFSARRSPTIMKSESTRTLDSNVCKKRFITPIPANIPPRIGFLLTNPMKSISMMARKSIPPITPHSTNCWIYQLSGM